MIGAVLEEFARSGVEAERDVRPELETRRLDRLADVVERGFRRRQIGSEAALVADIGVEAGLFQRRFQGVEHFRAPAHRLADAPGAHGQDHEFLEIDRIVGVNAAIDDIHLRRRQDAGLGAADIAVERQFRGVGRRLGDRERDAENGVGAEPRLVGRAVELDQGHVDRDLFFRVEAGNGVENFAIDRFHRPEHALAGKAGLVAVAQFDRLMGAGRGARGHGGAAEGAVLEGHIDLDRGIAARVQDFTGDDVDNLSHGSSSANCGFAVCGLLRPFNEIKKIDLDRNRSPRLARFASRA